MSRALNALGWMMVVIVLVGCVATKPKARPHATMLFTVILRGEVPESRQPSGLLVGIDGQQDSEGLQFAFSANTRIPGQYTSFLVRLELTPGPHRLTRLAGVLSEGTTTPEFDVTTGMSFEAEAGSRDYLGRLELSDLGPAVRGVPRLTIADAYEEDLPNLVHAWPTLRGRVSHRGQKGIAAIPTESRDVVKSVDAANFGSASKLDASASAQLPAAARAAFRTFLQGGLPRAFAIGSGGQTGMAVGGKDVIARALHQCQLAPSTNARRCRLFALDDTLTASLPGLQQPTALKK